MHCIAYVKKSYFVPNPPCPSTGLLIWPFRKPLFCFRSPSSKCLAYRFKSRQKQTSMPTSFTSQKQYSEWCQKIEVKLTYISQGILAYRSCNLITHIFDHLSAKIFKVFILKLKASKSKFMVILFVEKQKKRMV